MLPEGVKLMQGGLQGHSRVVDNLQAFSFLEGQVRFSPGLVVVESHESGDAACNTDGSGQAAHRVSHIPPPTSQLPDKAPSWQENPSPPQEAGTQSHPIAHSRSAPH